VTTVACTGHQGLPEEALAYIEPRLWDILTDAKDDLVGVCSLAAGADQLFARAVLRAGGQLHVIVPSSNYGAAFSNATDRSTYEILLREASSAEVLDYPEPSEDAFMEAGRRAVEMSGALIAIWDGEPARGKGGTADVVGLARELGRAVVTLWPPGVRR
jgi:hypothetical protein